MSWTSLLYYFLSIACFGFILLFVVIVNNTTLLRTFLCTFLLQFRSVTQPCLTLCDTMDYSMPGLPVHHQLPEFIQTHVHWASDAKQPSHPLLSPSPPAFNLSQHQGLFQWVTSLHQVAKLLEPIDCIRILTLPFTSWVPVRLFNLPEFSHQGNPSNVFSHLNP